MLQLEKEKENWLQGQVATSYMVVIVHANAEAGSNTDGLVQAMSQVSLQTGEIKILKEALVLELLHTHLGFFFPNFIPFLLFIISHYPVSYILGENIPLGEYSLSIDTSV